MSSKEMKEKIQEIITIMRSRFYGKYKGIVAEIGENDYYCSIRAYVPAVYGEEILSPWANPHVPFAGPNYGFVLLPKINDRVWIEFEGGDISRPIWTGYYWSCDNEIPHTVENDIRVLVTPKGHKIILDDKNDEIRLQVEDSEISLSNNEIILQKGTSKIVIRDYEVNINEGALVVK